MKQYYRHKVMVAAHRGNSRYFPENTLPAFESALSLDIDMVETDLHMTADGEIILMHDQTVERTTNGTGDIQNMTLAQIRTLDAGLWKGEEFRGTKVPTFTEFLELMKNRKEMLFNIEFKDFPHLQGKRAYESCDKCIAMMEEYGIAQRSVINSWSGELLEYIDKKYNHKYQLHGYFPVELMGENQTRSPYEYLYSMCLFDEKKIVTDKEHFDYAAAHGVEPWVYYQEEREDLYRMAVERGAVLFTANDPQKAVQVLDGLNVR